MRHARQGIGKYSAKGLGKNSGWDRLIVLEIFLPVGNSYLKYLLPLFIRNKFNKDNSTTKLNLKEINDDHTHCTKFMRKNIKLASGFALLPVTGNNYIILYVAKSDGNESFTKSPSNILFCFEEDLKRLYGPTLMSFLSTSLTKHNKMTPFLCKSQME